MVSDSTGVAVTLGHAAVPAMSRRVTGAQIRVCRGARRRSAAPRYPQPRSMIRLVDTDRALTFSSPEFWSQKTGGLFVLVHAKRTPCLNASARSRRRAPRYSARCDWNCPPGPVVKTWQDCLGGSYAVVPPPPATCCELP